MRREMGMGQVWGSDLSGKATAAEESRAEGGQWCVVRFAVATDGAGEQVGRDAGEMVQG